MAPPPELVSAAQNITVVHFSGSVMALLLGQTDVKPKIMAQRLTQRLHMYPLGH